MNQELKILNELRNTPGKNDKLQLLQDNSDNHKLAELLDATFNAGRIFHIKKFNDNPLPKNYTAGLNLHGEFLDLLTRLESGLRGNNAKAAVEDFLMLCGTDTAKWYARILRKDIKCGFSAKTAVKAGFDKIPVFDVMLAKDGKLCKKLAEVVAGGVWLSPKLDGYRCLAIVDDGAVTLLSRKGIEYQNFPAIVESLSNNFPTGQHIFDGEIMSDDFQAMQKSAFANKRKTTVGDVNYAIFGWVPYNEWTTKKFKMLTKDRLKKLKELSVNFDENLTLVEQTYTEDLAYIYKQQELWENAGYEGAMALPNIPYYLGKKTGRLIKFKTMETQDCVITGMYEGKGDTRLEGTMGGVVLRQENGKVCECGSGWNDVDRITMWGQEEFYVGEIIEVKYQELTKDGIMRFPVFMRFRNDK